MILRKQYQADGCIPSSKIPFRSTPESFATCLGTHPKSGIGGRLLKRPHWADWPGWRPSNGGSKMLPKSEGLGKTTGEPLDGWFERFGNPGTAFAAAFGANAAV